MGIFCAIKATFADILCHYGYLWGYFVPLRPPVGIFCAVKATCGDILCHYGYLWGYFVPLEPPVGISRRHSITRQESSIEMLRRLCWGAEKLLFADVVTLTFSVIWSKYKACKRLTLIYSISECIVMWKIISRE